ncbi:hypothetical protein sscle_01g003460 [Sclerotinia sclerotiorum 1980 UF-70]|uniref:Uncharacterized protein n=2 Tax=Sclerotinia sclerotiorum (strain ATCC 18683 / 1980 / Ss-1) TaxID=665079 RepID=A0A1D9PSE6_SCLS1|nr:hypothetical protein sscle_01g003460 [Sclerotinia sclerotiorum 1980 UF-70]
MGNKNARAKKSVDLPNLILPFPSAVGGESNGFAALSPKSPLAFKSFRQGTLITPNFESLGKGVAKSLSATSPEFVPAVPVKIASYPKVHGDTSSKSSAFEKSQNPQDLSDHAQLTGTTHQIYTKVGQLDAITELQMRMETGTVPANRIQLNSTNTHGLDLTTAFHRVRDSMDAISISSVQSTPKKTGSSPFVTPTKLKETPLSTPSPVAFLTGPRPEKSRFGRADKKKKDIIITKLGVIRNLARITERFTESGYPYKHASADEFQPDVYDVADTVSKMPAKEREEFWAKNWIEIEVDLRSKEEMISDNAQVEGEEKPRKDYETLLKYIDNLGPDFTAHARYMFVNIIFPSILDADQSKINSSVLGCQQTHEFQHIEKLVAKLQHFPKIKRLDVILQTPSNTKKPLSIPQLNLVLPFYDLGFTDWNIKWKTSFMTKAEPVGGWPIHYLDKERNRLLRERERVKNAIFVRKSQFVT